MLHSSRDVSSNFAISEPASRTQSSISLRSTQTELNALRIKICQIKGDSGKSGPAPKRLRRDPFPHRERFSQEGRSASAVRFNDRRSISRQIEFFRRSKNAVYITPGGGGKFSFFRLTERTALLYGDSSGGRAVERRRKFFLR